MPETVVELLQEAKRRAPSVSLRELRYLIEKRSGIRAQEQMLYPTAAVAPELVKTIFQDIKALEQGRPLERVVAESEFYGHSFRLNEACLIPRPASETLVEAALDAMQEKKALRVLDLCSGSGCLGLSFLAERQKQDDRLTLLDVSNDALLMSAENAKNLKLFERCRFLLRDLLKLQAEDLARLGLFDLIFFNPPYVTEEEYRVAPQSLREEDPKAALVAGQNGLLFYLWASRNLRPSLAPNALLLMEHGSCQRDAVKQLFHAWQEAGDSLSYKDDMEGHPRLIEVRRSTAI